MNTPHEFKFRKGQTVAYEYRPGEWRVISKTPADRIFANCTRYQISDGKETLSVRDKDIYPQSDPMYQAFINQ